jgi:immune inhibitor A
VTVVGVTRVPWPSRPAWVTHRATIAATGGLLALLGPLARPTPPIAAPPAAVAPSSTPTIPGTATALAAAPTAGETATDTVVAVPTAAVAPSPTARRPAAAAVSAAPSPPAPVAVSAPTIPAPPVRDLADLQRRLRPSPAASPTPLARINGTLGAEQSFWIADQLTRKYSRISARLTYETAHAYWYLEDGVGLPTLYLQLAGSYFEDHTYPTEHQLFGSEWSPGIDNDVHITVLVAHIPGVGGYYSSADEYPATVNPYSNQREMIYINADAVQPGTPEFNATVAHEFMHMIQFNVHRNQNSWINEGSAELAAQAVTGRTSADVPGFEATPSTQLNSWASDPSASIPHYGAAYLFMRYVAEHFGGFGAIGKVVAEPGRGTAVFREFFAGRQPPTTFERVFADWVAANELDDPALAGGQYGYQGLKLNPTVLPGPALGATLQGEATQFGATYYAVRPTAPATLTFAGATTVPLIGATPHGAPYEWWSNRGDSIDSQLTRAVDLRRVTSATLQFWAWYDIEKDYDYAYVEVSTDGGHTWTTLATGDTTSSNPNGQNYGNGWTGTSGGSTATWVPESANLTPYAGRQILLRFEYVTDDSYNADGLALDGIQIPAIGLGSPGDQTGGTDGWIANGFVRTNDRRLETYLVEMLDPTAPEPAQVLPVNAAGEATLTLAPNHPVVLAVAGLATLTTHQAPYQVSLVPR